MTVDRLICQGAEFGLKPNDVLDMSLRYFSNFIDGIIKTKNNEWKMALWTAYQTAAMTRVKRMPDLKLLLNKIDRAGDTTEEKEADLWNTIKGIHLLHSK